MTDLRTPENMREDEVVGEEELVPADDTIIGRAFKWSLLVFAAIGLTIGVMVWMVRRPAEVVHAEPPVFVPPQVIDVPATPPLVTFTDITKQAGIDFVHVNGATGDKLLPETMGGGCAFLDYNNDRHQDILLINSTHWPTTETAQPRLASSHPTTKLYRNKGDGAFTDVTTESGLNINLYGMGCAAGDYDNDGHADIFISALGRNRLFRNLGGYFTEVTNEAGVAGDEGAWSTSAAFFDYNNDGKLDLFVCNYVKWSREIDFAVNFTLTGIGRAYGPPTHFEGAHSYLYRNNGDGTFADVSADAGIHMTNQDRPMGKALAVIPIDIDDDGFIDLIVANDTVQNFLFHNQGDGTFKDKGAEFGVAFDRNGNSTGAMGVDAARYRNDNSLGVVIGNFANEMSSLYVAQNHPHQFADEAIGEGIGSPTRSRLTFGAFFFDYDLDGRLDLLHANGHIEDDINIVQPSQHYQQPAQLFWNAGPDARACYVEVPSETLGDLSKPMVGRGAAFADIDGDGDLDVLLTQVNGAPMLLRNELYAIASTASEGETAAGGNPRERHWLRIKLIGNGTTVNRDAIGTQIEVTAGGITQRQQVMPARSYLSQVELPVTFGLGAQIDRVDALRIRWPDGSVQEIHDLQADTLHTIRQH